MAIPIRILEQINNSELNAADFYKIYGKQEIETELERLRKSDNEILNKYSAEKMRLAVERKLAANKNRHSNEKRTFQPARNIQLAAAAAILCTVCIPAGLRVRSQNEGNISIAAEKTASNSADSVRIKGNALNSIESKNPKLNLYRQTNGKIQSLDNGTLAKPGDVIQITYNAGKEEYGVIFSVDGNGNITRHFPENSWHAEALSHNMNETPLDFSYELDNAPDFECFIMVTSKKEFELNDIEQKIKNKTDINYLKSLSYLPKKTDGITFVLEK